MACARMVVGTYEGKLLGFDTDTKDTLTPRFIEPAHTGCVKCVAASGRHLVSGSTDETIRVFDIYRNVDVGTCFHHTGAVTCLAFHATTHLLSGSEDTSIGIWRTSDWQLLLPLKGHKDPVNDLAIHVSGRMALSTSRDKTLRLWDLTTGKCSHTRKLEEEAGRVAWSPEGHMHAITVGNDVHIYSSASGRVVRTLCHTKRLLTLTYIRDDLLATAGEDRVVKIYDVGTGNCLRTLEGHTNRIRGLSVASTGQEGALRLASASSDGFVKVWNPEDEGPPLSEIDTGDRLTCVVMTPVVEKRKKRDMTKAAMEAALEMEKEDQEEDPKEEEEKEEEEKEEHPMPKSRMGKKMVQEMTLPHAKRNIPPREKVRQEEEKKRNRKNKTGSSTRRRK